MKPDLRQALAVVRRCVAAGRYVLLPHFTRRMDQRGFVWPDALLVLTEATRVQHNGLDHHGREKWIIGGTTADGVPLDMVCVLDTDEYGSITVFITAY
jgi:hypothetical protein